MSVRGLEPERKAALVVNEFQRGTVDPAVSVLPELAAQADQRAIASRIAWLAEQFRAAGLPVVHTPIVHRPGLEGVPANCQLLGVMKKMRAFEEGSVHVEYHPEVQPASSDFVLTRVAGIIAWHATPLDLLLRNLGVNTVVLTGVSTNLAIPGLTIDAVNRGFSVVIAEDATAGTSPEIHDFVLTRLLPVVATISNTTDIAAAIVGDRS
jgi:nicotinamidase-related amidase